MKDRKEVILLQILLTSLFSQRLGIVDEHTALTIITTVVGAGRELEWGNSARKRKNLKRASKLMNNVRKVKSTKTKERTVIVAHRSRECLRLTRQNAGIRVQKGEDVKAHPKSLMEK